MESRFLAINDTVTINPEVIETVDIAPDGGVLIHFSSGNNRTLTGDDAAGFLRFAKPLTAQLPAAPKTTAPAGGYDSGEHDSPKKK